MVSVQYADGDGEIRYNNVPSKNVMRLSNEMEPLNPSSTFQDLDHL